MDWWTFGLTVAVSGFTAYWASRAGAEKGGEIAKEAAIVGAEETAKHAAKQTKEAGDYARDAAIEGAREAVRINEKWSRIDKIDQAMVDLNNYHNELIVLKIRSKMNEKTKVDLSTLEMLGNKDIHQVRKVLPLLKEEQKFLQKWYETSKTMTAENILAAKIVKGQSPEIIGEDFLKILTKIPEINNVIGLSDDSDLYKESEQYKLYRNINEKAERYIIKLREELGFTL